ncbi:hypothetical protein BP6252_13363 [Coleophoma cylindrospora]|uniref:Xylanolytic transcriptional activator regulatory domain-containing protein n=1 Tax=Coleophoma cylindrospora TaxID=1849047 RepID=A0A3D8QB12_9HELO|nr:hypothetical protein BP6252_13363 [Coleophoma cylindrospora]
MAKRPRTEAQDGERNSTSPDDNSLHLLLDQQPQERNPKRASFGAASSPPFINSVNRRRQSFLGNHVRTSPPGNMDTGMPAIEHAQQQSQGVPPRPASADKPRNEQPIMTLGITRKIKCLMDDDRPPCRRCRERNLSCVLNKSLQSHMDDESRWRNTVSHDLVHIHKALDNVLRSLSQPVLPALETTILREQTHARNFDDASSPTEIGHEMCDVSPQLSPTVDEFLAQIPIESLYEITRLRSLRSTVVDTDPASEPQAKLPAIDDFITKGVIQVHEAERLVQFYLTRLDPYIYGIGGAYTDLQSLRRASPVLAACICTVSALHEPDNNKLYEVCNKEFRRLVANTMFDRHLSAEYLRALCIGSYWLSDISWTLSGMAVRRAGDFHLHKYYYKALSTTDTSSPTGRPDPAESLVSMDRARLWYLLYICDQHLSILYNRAPMIREEETILGWKAYSECSDSTDSDMRISSQVALLLILSQIRDLFGTDTSEPIPRAFATHISSFSQQLDKWLAQWSTALRANDFIGEFPSKGVLLHYHFGKLHLYAHVFRGLKNENGIDAIPAHFKDAASTAVTAAVNILELLLQDADLRKSLVGVPHYFHTMIAFAGVVLLKVSAKYHEQLSIDLEAIFTLTSSVISLFRSTACSRYHLVHWMATGLEKMLQNCKMVSAGRSENTNHNINGDMQSGYSVMDQQGSWNLGAQSNGAYNGTTPNPFQNNPMTGNEFGTEITMLMSEFPPGEFDMGFNFI